MKKIIVLMLLFPLLGIAQHSISGTFNPKEQFSKVFLYQVTPTSPRYISNEVIDKEGKTSVSLNNDLAPGMYRLVFGIPQDEYFFDFIYNGKEDINFLYKSGEGATFLSSKENLLLKEYNQKADEAKGLLSSAFSPSTSKKDFLKVFKAVQTVQNEYESKSEGMLANHFIKTGRIPIPTKKLTTEEYLKLEQEEFFNHIDFNDAVLQHSDYLVNACIIYVIRFGNEDPNKQKKAIDDMMIKTNGNTAIQKNALEELWQNFSTTENIEIANYITDTYLEKIAQEQGDAKLLAEIATYKKTGVGAKAPDFNLGDGRKLSDLHDATHYLLVFWSSTCSHCLKEIPQVKKFLDNIDQHKIEVVAFGLENDEHPWKDTIKSYPDFIHVYGAGKWSNATSNEYNVTSTPTYFILDAYKKIVAKPNNLEDLELEINKLTK